MVSSVLVTAFLTVALLFGWGVWAAFLA